MLQEEYRKYRAATVGVWPCLSYPFCCGHCRYATVKYAQVSTLYTYILKSAHLVHQWRAAEGSKPAAALVGRAEGAGETKCENGRPCAAGVLAISRENVRSHSCSVIRSWLCLGSVLATAMNSGVPLSKQYSQPQDGAQTKSSMRHPHSPRTISVRDDMGGSSANSRQHSWFT